MLRCAASHVVAAYPKVRLTPQDLRALPADFLRSRPHFDFLRVYHDCLLEIGSTKKGLQPNCWNRGAEI